MEQPPETLLARLSGRDDFINRDGWGITLDTSGEGLYGYWFTVNLGGSVMDGKVAPEREISREWDGPWQSATQALDDGWSVEVFLPWSMMTMPHVEGDRTMGVWLYRQVAHVDEQWSWPALPFTGARFMSALQPLRLPGVEPTQQLSVYPYGSTSYDNGPNVVDHADYRAGADVFWRPTSNLQLSATLYPDFGTVESDDVVVNLTSRETFFPEKRLFFLEGNEIFTTSPRSQVQSVGTATSATQVAGARRTASSFTPTPTTLINTRRIGGAPIVTVPDDVDLPGYERSKPTELVGALKVTGQTGALRYGVLGAFEDEVERLTTRDGEPFTLTGDGRDFGVARLVWENTGAGRQAVGYIGTLIDHPDLDARSHGIDLHHLSRGGTLKTDIQLAMSDVEGQQGYGGWADIIYTPSRGIQHTVGLDYLDEDIDLNDLGFLQRNDLIGGRYAFNYTRSGMRRFRVWRSGINVGHWLNADSRNVRTGVFFRNTLMFNNRSEVRTALNFFPERWDDLESRGNGAYKINDRWVWEVALGTDSSKAVSWSAQAGGTQEDLSGWRYDAGVGVTFKPVDRFSVDLDINYRRHEAWLLHQDGRDFTTFEADDWQPKLAMDLFLTARQQIRLTMQWAGIVAEEREFFEVPAGEGFLVPRVKDPSDPADDFTISRLTAQLRYRWEIAPLSDLFVVYTRGSNLPNRVDDEFGDLFSDALNEPVVDLFVVKLRYRFGR